MGGIFAVFIMLVRAVFLVVLGASLSVIVIASTAAHLRPFDPFAPYAYTVVDEPLNDFIRDGFECQPQIVASYGWTCSMKPSAGVFSEIQMNVTYSERETREIIYILRQSTLCIGDLAVLWGTPSVMHIHDQYAAFAWDNAHATTTVMMAYGRFSYFQPVSAVTISLGNSV